MFSDVSQGLQQNLVVAFLFISSRFLFLEDIPVFTEEPLSVVQKLGGSVTLRCSALPDHVNITWRLNGRELPDGGDEELGLLVQPGSLYIPSLSNLTVGRYQCVATASVGSRASVPANVTAASE